MGWRVFGERLDTADMTPPYRVFQPLTFNSTMRLKAIRTWFSIYNNPTFTDISLKLYTYRNSAPDILISTSSNSVAKASVHTLSNGMKEVGFYWTNPLAFHSGEQVAVVPVLSGYTGTSSSHVAWVRGYPDGIYKTNVSQVWANLLTRPFSLYLIGKEFDDEHS